MINLQKDAKTANALLHNAQNVLITTHQKPDGDALGSMCAMIQLASFFGFSFTAVVDMLPENYLFLPGVHHIQLAAETDITIEDYDVMVTLDFNTVSRSPIAEIIEAGRAQNIPLINFDHHHGNSLFGTANMVDVHEASTTSLIYELVKVNDLPISESLATALLTGIMTDTDHLSNSATTEYVIRATADLVLHGGQLQKITQNTRYNKDLKTMNLWGKALDRLTLNPRYNIAYTVITQQDLIDGNVSSEALEGLPNFLTSVEEADAILVLKEQPDGTIRGSFRTTSETVDVSALAKCFGGGGHIKAAGFAVEGSLQQTATGWKIV
jgi:phosphoesterase RecJ-like protein